MKVALKVTVHVDVEKYRYEYAEHLSLDDIRSDIVQDVENAMDQAFPGRLGKEIFPLVEVR